MCNLYSMTKNQDAIRDLFKVKKDSAGNIPPMPGIFPNYRAPVVRMSDEGRELTMIYRGMPGPPERGGYNTNIRHVSLPHWQQWMGPDNRCLIPATSFAEYAAEPDPATGKKDIIWFALSKERPPFAFAGIWTEWNGNRGPAKNPTVTVHRLAYALLTTRPNAVVKPIHNNAMPVILLHEDWETWLTADAKAAAKLQKPWPADRIEIVARGSDKEDIAA